MKLFILIFALGAFPFITSSPTFDIKDLLRKAETIVKRNEEPRLLPSGRTQTDITARIAEGQPTTDEEKFTGKYVEHLEKECEALQLFQEQGFKKIRLRANGDDVSTGRVQIRYYGEWMHICNDGLEEDKPNGVQTATVICKSLGYASGKPIPSSQVDPGEIGSGLLKSVKCKGSEPSLGECEYNTWGICDPNEFFCVSCSYK